MATANVEVNAVGKKDVFPQTMATWLGEKLRLGEAGRAEANRHIMEVYAVPLGVYYRGHSLRHRFQEDPDDVVRGFFADRLSRPAFLAGWLESGIPLRYWLMNALEFHLQEQCRKRFPGGLPDDSAIGAVETDPARDFDRSFAVEVVRKALRQARDQCRREDLALHWEVFVLHCYRGLSYEAVEAKTGIPPKRATVMNRTAKERFKEAVWELFARDGAGRTAIEEDIRRLLEDL
jgi:hypothetical protein